MGDVNFLKRFSKYFISASFLGLVIAIVSFYYEVHGNRVHMSMDIAAESNVLDVKHPIPDLAVLFQGRDIEEEKSNLKILAIRVVNDGEANIHENDFDSRMPFGLQVNGGKVIRAQVVGGNSPYLTQNVNPKVDEGNQVVLDKVIFDKGKYVSLEILVLHPKNSAPQLVPMGKIAGLEQIAVTDSSQTHDQQNFFGKVFAGPVAVQIVRALVYSVLSLLGVVIVGFFIAGLVSIPSTIQEKKRRHIASRLPVLDSPELEKKRKALEEIYIHRGLSGLKRAQKLLSDKAALKAEIAVLRRVHAHGTSVALDITHEDARPIRRQVQFPDILAPLIAADLVAMREGGVHIDPDIMFILIQLIEQVSSGGDSTIDPAAG